MVYPYLQFGQNLAQRLANTPAGQAAAGYMQRGGEALGRFENRWPSMARGPMGQFPAREAADKIPLAPVSGALAGAAGVGSAATGGAGSFGTLSNPFSSGPQSTVPQSLFDELTRRGGGVPQNPSPPVATTSSTTLMDSIMAGRTPSQSGAFGLQGASMPGAQYGSSEAQQPQAMMNTPAPEYRMATPPMPPSRPALPGRTPGFLDQLLSGQSYQSNNMPVDVRAQGPSMPGQEMPIQSINYGDPNSAADFFRADQLAMQNPNIPGFLGGY